MSVALLRFGNPQREAGTGAPRRAAGQQIDWQTDGGGPNCRELCCRRPRSRRIVAKSSSSCRVSVPLLPLLQTGATIQIRDGCSCRRRMMPTSARFPTCRVISPNVSTTSSDSAARARASIRGTAAAPAPPRLGARLHRLRWRGNLRAPRRSERGWPQIDRFPSRHSPTDRNSRS